MKKLMTLVAIFAMITGSAYAADWNFYGNARVQTFVTDTDNPGVVADTKNYGQSVQGNSRIGANIKVSDELTARFEYGTGVNVRILSGTWNFGSGSLTAGNFWTPVNQFHSSQAYAGDNGLGGWGVINSGRQAGLQLDFGGFAIGVFETYSTEALLAGTTTEVKMPRFEAKYVYNFENGFAKAIAGYQTYDLETAVWSEDITSYLFGVNGAYTMGAFSVKAGLWMGQNIGTFSSWGNAYMANTSTGATSANPTVTAAGTVTDTDAYGYSLIGVYVFNDMFSMELGYGFAANEYDMSASKEDDVVSYYVSAPVVLAPGVFIVPEIGKVDYKDDNTGAQEADLFYYGIKWQINF